MAKSRSREVAKAAEKPKEEKKKTAVVLSLKAIERLGLACVDHGKDQSQIVEELINANLSGYVLQVRGPRFAFGGKSDDQVAPSVPVMVDESANQAGCVSQAVMQGI